MLGTCRILIGITGGIAAYKIPSLIRLLKKMGAEVKVVITPGARGIVGEDALRTVSGNPVYADNDSQYDMDHIRLAQWADLLLICPATANTIAKIAHGIADNLLTTLSLSIPESKIMIAPAMNTVMWNNFATQANIKLLKHRGIHVLPVGTGELACGTDGIGRMIDIEQIARFAQFGSESSSLLKGKKVLISSGPTEEHIDPVRVLTNRSSGKMGASLASEALLMGADVTVVSGPAICPLPSGVKVESVQTAQQMQSALANHFQYADICIMAAAVSDYRSEVISPNKIQRNENGKLVLELVPNPDILAGLGKQKSGTFLVGFALESSDSCERALEKMDKKGCDMIIFNSAAKSLGLDTTQITILGRDGYREDLPVMSKTEAAKVILLRIAEKSNKSHV